MSPPSRRRRRARRPRATVVAAALVVAVAAGLLVGGLLRVGAQSTGYWRAIDRSYAATVTPVVAASGRLGSQLRREIPSMPGQGRTAAEQALDELVRSSAAQAAQAAAMADPSPAGGVAAGVAGALGQRAQAMADLRTALDRLLQMAPLPAAGATGVAVAAVSDPPSPISQTAARRALTRVGALLGEADRAYAGARRALHAGPGRASIPRSAWTGHPSLWAPAPVSELVGALVASSTLASRHDVVLLTKSLALTPAPIPANATTSPGSAVVPPTTSLRLRVVVADEGNVAERRVPVRVVATPDSGAAAGHPPSKSSARVTVAPGSSVSVGLGPLKVRPGTIYTVRVFLSPPPGEVAGAVTAHTFVLDVAPAGR